MELVKHETCLEYFHRRLSEGWKCISLEGHNAVLLSPAGNRREIDLRHGVETLRPNAGGAETNQEYYNGVSTYPPDPNENWKQVDEVVADGQSTYCTERHSGSSERDLYNLPASSGSGVISKITLHFLLTGSSGYFGRGVIRSDSTVTEDEEKDSSGSYPTFVHYTKEWALNPADSQAWSWADIDALQIGTRLYGSGVGLSMCTQVYVEIDYTPPPDPPTNCVATDGDHNDKVVITWTKSTGATGYQVYRDGTPLGWLGDVATHDDAGAGAPTITPGDAVAGDGGSTAHVALYISGEGTSNGATHTYKVKARHAGGESGDSNTDTGYRSPGALTYQWQRSAADSDAGYGNIAGTTEAYNDTGAPAPTVTPGTATAGDGASTAHVTLSLAGESANIGDGRWYRCVLDASGCAQQITGTNRGYRGVGALTRQWYRSAADSDAGYGSISGATTDPYNDVAAPAPTITPGTGAASDGTSPIHVTLGLSGQSANIGAGRWYKCLCSATGATPQYSTANRGYRGVGSLTYQWQRSPGDADSGHANISGATTDPYNDTAAPAPTITPGTGAASDGTSPIHVTLSLSGQSANIGAGRWYRCVLNATGATQQISTTNRGYRSVGSLTYQWQRSPGDADSGHANISGATTEPYNDTGAPGNGQGRYYQCVESATGASPQTSSSDRGYRFMGGKTAHMAAKMI